MPRIAMKSKVQFRVRIYRDDSIAMQYLLPGWAFDPKRPALVR